MASTDPLPLNFHSIWGIVSISITALFGISSIIATARANNPYNDNWFAASIAAMSLGACSMVSAISAYSLTYVGARQYIKERNSRSIKGLMIASWVMFGILIVNGIGLVAMGATDRGVPGVWVAFVEIWAIIGWGLMAAYAERARKEEVLAQNVLPMTTMTETTQLDTYSSYYPQQPRTSGSTTTITVTELPDGCKKTIKTTIDNYGIKTVEETIEEPEEEEEPEEDVEVTYLPDGSIKTVHITYDEDGSKVVHEMIERPA